MAKETKKPIRCEVVRVDEGATSCQEEGNTFLVDENIGGKLCARSQELVEAAANQFDAGSVDVPCPDDYVLFRLSHVDWEEAHPAQKSQDDA